MRVVIDTNVLVSRLLVTGSVSASAVDKALVYEEVIISESTVDELTGVLSRENWDRYVSIKDRQEFVRRLLQIATMVSVISETEDCMDPADNQFLALALDGQAACILTGDKDLLALHPWRGIEIICPADFLAYTGTD